MHFVEDGLDVCPRLRFQLHLCLDGGIVIPEVRSMMQGQRKLTVVRRDFLEDVGLAGQVLDSAEGLVQYWP